jgi:3-dehydro-L-gulonate 2-dehydrogenase
VIGGFDFQGNLSSDPSEIEKSGRPLPIGYWKGSGLSLMLDVVATLLSDGTPTFQIPSDVVQETRLSQVFIAIKPTENNRQETLEAILAFLKASQTNEASVRYPGERTLQTREQNMAQGIPVDDVVWDQILNL